MTILTEEMIETAAVKIDPLLGMYGCSPERRQRVIAATRAALTAILPDVVEACAQQVIGTQSREDAMAFIRELAPRPQD